MQLWLEELYKKMIKALSQIDCVNISTLPRAHQQLDASLVISLGNTVYAVVVDF